MADIDAARQKPIEQFYEHAESVHAGMLGIDGTGLQFQPMAPQVDRASKTIWFFTKKDAEIVKQMTGPARGRFVVISEDHDYHASVSGQIEQTHDRSVIERFWNPVVDAWYKGGKDDPDLTLLALRLENGEAWASTDSSLKFGWEIARANVDSDHKPEVGVHVDLKF